MTALAMSQPPDMAGAVLSCGRDYQDRIVKEAELHWWSGHRGVLTVMPTGTGKTRVASVGIARYLHGGGGRVLWLAHRIELVNQARKSLSETTGRVVGMEVPGMQSDGESIVVASKDTIRTDGRLSRLRSQDFTLVAIDEAHHSVARTYSKVIETWPQACLWGLTATPDRLDKRGLSHFTAQTTPFTVPDAIRDGWLVPVLAQRARIKSVDLSKVKTQGGDFAPGELDAVMCSEESIQGMCQAILDKAGSRPTLIYCTSVAAAHRTAEILDRHKSGSARAVDGSTPADERASIFRSFLAGQFQYLCNVEIATEGTDLPLAACVAMCRPTKSRSLFVQMLGRVLRPYNVDLNKYQESARRQLAIAESCKPNALVLDFTSNTGKHSVVSADTVLSDGRITEAVQVRLRRKIDQAGDGLIDVEEAIRAAQKDENEAEARRAARKEREAEARRKAIQTGTIRVDVLDTKIIGLGGVYDGGIDQDGQPTVIDPGQIEAIKFLRIPFISGETRAQARRRIQGEQARLAKGCCTWPQYETIRKFYPNLASLEMSKLDAGKRIARLAMRGWKP